MAALLLLSVPAGARADTLERPGLVVRYDPIDAARAAAAADLVRTVGGRVAAQLGEPLPAPLSVELAKNDAAFDRVVEALSGAPPPRWALAVAVPARRAIVIRAGRLAPATRNDLVPTLAHELAHVVLAPVLAPRWLDEGLAMWAEGRRLSGGERNELGALARRDALPALEDLAFSFPPHAEQAATAYLESLAFVEALLADFGEPALRAFIARLARAVPLEEAFERTFEAPLSAYEKAFRRDLAKRYSFWRELFERGSLWTLAGVLAIIAFARYWWRRRRALREMEAAERGPEEDRADPRSASPP
jgi:hypothetical protein